jgi:TolB-like protein
MEGESPIEASTSVGAVFLSYASEDAPAAQRLCQDLRAAGIEVWIDQSELRGGDAWDAEIQKQIRECVLFVPLISASTNARGEGYFRLEWRLAVERSYRLADDQAFLLPVLIDTTPQALARVPDRFRERHWSQLEGGAATSAFISHVRHLLSTPHEVATALSSETHRAGTALRRRGWPVACAALAAIAAAGLVALVKWDGHLAHREPAAGSLSAAASHARTAALARTSIAVLPFDNLSGHSDDAYLADGLQEEILNALARLRALTVISRTSVMQFRGGARNVREIAQRLGVGSVLEGSIRRADNTLRLTIQLIDARDDRHVFAANYDREMSRILDLQSTVARQVADALTATLTQYERGELERVATNNGDAYDRYLRALALFHRPVPNDDSGLTEPRRLLEEALRFDPDYTDALALLSQAATWAFELAGHREDGIKAEQTMQRALTVDPQLPEGILARGLYTMYVARDPDRALNDLQAAVQMRPNSVRAQQALGLALRRRARWAEALEHLTRARDLDPLNDVYADAPLATLLGLRRYPEAREASKLTVQRFPDGPAGYWELALIECYFQHSVEPLRGLLRDHGILFSSDDTQGIIAAIAVYEGRYHDAIAAAKQMPNEPLRRNTLIGFWYFVAGEPSSAMQAFQIAERSGREQVERDPENIDLLRRLALVESMLGEHDAALATIERARALVPEARDAINGPPLSFMRSVILVRAGRSSEGYAEAERLQRVPFGTPRPYFDYSEPEVVMLKNDPHFDALISHAPRL